MRAKDIYNKNIKDIRILADAIRFQGRPGHVETRSKDYQINSAQVWEDDIDIADTQTIGGEIAGIHTLCQVKPIRKDDIKMTCVEIEDNKANELRACLRPIGLDILNELAGLAREQEEVTVDLIKKFLKGEIDEKQANREYKKRLAGSLRDEKEIISYVEKYRNARCGDVHKLLTVVETRHGKLIETNERRTKPVRL